MVHRLFNHGLLGLGGSMFNFEKIDPTEKKILSYALIFTATQLFLIGIAVAFLGRSVPTCQPNEKVFQKGEFRSVGPKRYEVHYLAKMWSFEPQKIVIPTGSTVDFFLASKDVTHGFHINKTNINLLAVPGVINKSSHTFDKPGTYPIICHEYCGLGHENMHGEIIVADNVVEATSDLPQETVTPPSETPGLPTKEVPVGKILYEQKACVACHSLDGSSRVGPSFKGIWNKTVELEDGTQILVDEAYLTESIEEPLVKIVKGFGPTMPKTILTPEEVKTLIEFIKTIE